MSHTVITWLITKRKQSVFSVLRAYVADDSRDGDSFAQGASVISSRGTRIIGLECIAVVGGFLGDAMTDRSGRAVPKEGLI
jgi:hypothetical protein